jgi:hypothetical protein
LRWPVAAMMMGLRHGLTGPASREGETAMRFKASYADWDEESARHAIQGAGGQISDHLEMIKVFLGEIDHKKWPILAAIPGLRVEEDQEVHLPPPDSPLQ